MKDLLVYTQNGGDLGTDWILTEEGPVTEFPRLTERVDVTLFTSTHQRYRRFHSRPPQ